MKNKFKWLISILLVFVLLASFATTAYAAGDSVATATSISTGVQYSGSITESNSKDVYKFTLNSSGKINISLKAYIYRTDYYLYNENGETVWQSTYRYWNGTTEIMSMDENIDLIKGTYYFAISKNNGTGNYNFKISFTSANESFSETLIDKNNDIASADKISTGKTYKGQIAINDDKDLYKFTLSSSGKINIRLDAKIYKTNYYLYNENGETVWQSTYRYWNGTTEVMSMNENIDLIKGTYYFAITRNDGTGNYNFKIGFTSAGESFAETLTHKNNDIASADEIVIDKTYKGQIAANDNKDLYKFKLGKTTKAKIKAVANIYKLNYYLYDQNGNTVWSRTYVYWNNTTQKSTIEETLDLSAGTYYFAVERIDGTGNYSFYINHTHITKAKTAVKATLAKNGKTNYVCSYCGKVVSSKTVYTPKKFSLSTTQYSYNGKVKTPSVTVKDSKGNTLKKNTDYTVKYSSGRKSIGKYCVTVTFKGKYSGTKKLYFTIGPKATSKITATQSTSAITLKWNKVSGAKGYRVYKYNTKTKKYDKLKDVAGTSLKISKLKAGTVYKYRVQAYAKKSGTTLWGAKSSVFTTATKPATPKITKLTSKYSGSAYIKWSNVSGENGYEVYYSTSKNKGYTYAGYTSANNVSGTKYYLTSRKTYYFKVRSYKIVSGKYIYSAWSTPKGVKVK